MSMFANFQSLFVLMYPFIWSLISTCEVQKKQLFLFREFVNYLEGFFSWLMTGIHCFWHKLLDFNSCPLINLSEGETNLALCNVL